MKIELLFITPDAERLIESAGRTSYLSFNKQGKDSDKKFVRMLIKRGHLSVIEHAYATFRISGVSRALTHQLVRHRFSSITQQSQRYVNENNFNYIEPESVRNNPKAHSIFVNLMEKIRDTYIKLKDQGIKKEDARFILPNATESQLVLTANLREWRHIIELRGDPAAQWEIRKMALEILKIFKKHVPTIFEDLVINEEKLIIEKINIS
ncbi:MAG: FAD-dependent thymidylate synthase [Candidatus Lokiarchaeota archaeon]|nr:FAD-dependent thymidylate synthase [Candidatus Lokiarchaeota archaeon]